VVDKVKYFDVTTGAKESFVQIRVCCQQRGRGSRKQREVPLQETKEAAEVKGGPQ